MNHTQWHQISTKFLCKVIFIILIVSGNFSLAKEQSEPNKTHQWLPSEQLKPGMRVTTASGQQLTVTKGWQQRKQPQKTYNLEVNGTHTYFVGKNKIWVHNNCFEVLKHNTEQYDDFIKVYHEESMGMNAGTEQTAVAIYADKTGAIQHIGPFQYMKPEVKQALEQGKIQEFFIKGKSGMNGPNLKASTADQLSLHKSPLLSNAAYEGYENAMKILSRTVENYQIFKNHTFRTVTQKLLNNL